MRLPAGQKRADLHNLWRIILGSVFTMKHLLLLPACSWHSYHSTALVEWKMIIPWLPVPLKPIGSCPHETRMLPGESCMQRLMARHCWVGYWLKESKRKQVLCKAKILVDSLNTLFSSSLLSLSQFLPPPPPPSSLVLFAALLLLLTLLCNLIHLVMAQDQYPFSLALGRASSVCLFQTAVVSASRGSHGPAGWNRCTTPACLRKQSEAYI